MADQSENAKSSSRSNTVILIVGAIIIVALLVVILVLVLGGKKQDSNDNTTAQQQEKRAVVVSQDKAEEIVEEMVQQEYVEPGYYEAVMSTTWTFADGEAESKDAYVENVPSNTNDVYFDLFLADDEEHAIYESPVIPRGEKLENIKLDEKLSAGNYDGLLIYHLVDEEQNPISEVRVGLKIVVEN